MFCGIQFIQIPVHLIVPRKHPEIKQKKQENVEKCEKCEMRHDQVALIVPQCSCEQ